MWNRQQHQTAMISEQQDTELAIGRLAETGPIARIVGATIGLSPQNHMDCRDYRSLGDTADVRQVVSAARFLITNVIRDILGRQTDLEPWIPQDVLRFQNAIEHMATQVKGRITKLEATQGHRSTASPVGADQSEDQNMERLRYDSIYAWGLVPTPQNAVFVRWAPKLLNLMIEKAYCTIFQPLQKCSDPALWLESREM